jgi:predicted ATPase/DNA-binding SARP family transcriptional activator
MREPVQIVLFGGFRLIQADKPVTTLASPNLQALLAYLLLFREMPHSRQHLAFLLWPDSSEAQAQSNLRTLLGRLRTAWRDSDRFVQADNRTVQWRNDAPFTLDVQEFQDAIQLAQSGARQSYLERAVKLYRGDLLPHYYADWILPQRERLQLKFLNALEELIRLLETQQDYNAALVHAQHLLQLDPLQETTYQLLMRLHAARGDRSNVLRTFRQCETVLRRELDAEPSPATRALFETLQQSEPVKFTGAQITRTSSNLPVPLTSFIGREGEIREVKHLFSRTRLLTLTGAGGSGKTRLALQVAREMTEPTEADEVCWVELAALTDPAQVTHAVAAALAISEQPGSPLIDTLMHALKSRPVLLVLDNCEHLIAACASFAYTLLTHCAQLKILASSREPLGVLGESVYRVPPLSVEFTYREVDWELLTDVDAPRLFIERAQAVLPTFTLTQANALFVVQLCKRLDGIPLAIELAAARVNVLSVREISERLARRFDLLTTGVRTTIPRHQTLRAALDWSYGLLAEAEQSLFARLAVFAGGWTLEAIEQVCGREPFQQGNMLDFLSRLVDKSLVTTETRGGETRYRMLETIREYSFEKLASAGQLEHFRERHRDWFLDLAEQVRREEHLPTIGQRLDQLEREHDNMRAALEWSLQQGHIATAFRLANLLSYFWQIRGHWSEGRACLERVLTVANFEPERVSHQETILWAQALGQIGIMAVAQRDLDAARQVLAKSIQLYKNVAQSGILDLETKLDTVLSVNFLGFAAFYQSDYLYATARFTEALHSYQEAHGLAGVGFTLTMLGRVAIFQGQYERAVELGKESLAIGRQLGGVHLSAAALDVTARALYPQGNLQQAQHLLEESLTLSRSLDHQADVADELTVLGLVTSYAGDYRRARQLLQEAQTLSETIQYSSGRAFSMLIHAQVALAENDLTSAKAFLVESLKMYRTFGMKWHLTRGMELMAAVASAESDSVRAAVLFGAAEAIREAIGAPLPPCDLPAHQRAIESAQAQLGKEKFTVAWAQGRGMIDGEELGQGLGRAIDYALEQVESGV